MKEELLKGLTEEQIEKIKACKNQEEMLAIAKEEGVELNEEQLEVVSGGGACSSHPCPQCHSGNVVAITQFGRANGYYRCLDCDHVYKP